MRNSIFAKLNGSPGRIESVRKNSDGAIVCTFKDRQTWARTTVNLSNLFLPKKSEIKLQKIIGEIK